MVLLESIRSDFCFWKLYFPESQPALQRSSFQLNSKANHRETSFEIFYSDNSSNFHLQYHDSHKEQRFLANNDSSR